MVSKHVKPAVVAAVFLMLAVLLVGCNGPSAVDTPTPSPTNTALATATPTLPALATRPGWRVTAHFGYVQPGVVNSGVSFVASKAYQVVFTCEGSGTLTLSFNPPDTQVIACTAAPQTHEVIDLSPPVGSSVSINGAAQPNVIWQAVVAVQE